MHRPQHHGHDLCSLPTTGEVLGAERWTVHHLRGSDESILPWGALEKHGQVRMPCKVYHDGSAVPWWHEYQSAGWQRVLPVISCHYRVNQDCVLAPIQFCMVFSTMLRDVFRDRDIGVSFCYYTGGGLLNLLNRMPRWRCMKTQSAYDFLIMCSMPVPSLTCRETWNRSQKPVMTSASPFLPRGLMSCTNQHLHWNQHYHAWPETSSYRQVHLPWLYSVTPCKQWWGGGLQNCQNSLWQTEGEKVWERHGLSLDTSWKCTKPQFFHTNFICQWNLYSAQQTCQTTRCIPHEMPPSGLYSVSRG